jgi:hypothetical protein
MDVGLAIGEGLLVFWAGIIIGVLWLHIREHDHHYHDDH